jgi:hypothetical protein
MWRYVLAAFLFVIGAIEILLALNKPMREEILKASPIQSTRVKPPFLIMAAASAFFTAFVLIFYHRLL